MSRNRERTQSTGAQPLSPARLLMGRRGLQEVLRYCPERIELVYAAVSSSSKSDVYDELLGQIKQLKVTQRFVSGEELSALAGSESHQGFVALLKERQQPVFKEFLSGSAGRESSLLVMLDSIFDPHNFGAILRAAECFGAEAVVYSRNRGCGLSPVVRKTSVGASELLNLIQVNNLVESLRKMKEQGFWAVAADASEAAQDLSQMSFAKKTVLVLGSEGKGISPLLLKECDFRVRIPMKGKIESLNVSQAGAILMQAYCSQIK